MQDWQLAACLASLPPGQTNTTDYIDLYVTHMDQKANNLKL